MSKLREAEKPVKKVPEKTLKEKRAEKEAKRREKAKLETHERPL
ncbi:MAG: hypothetical protein WCG93_07485 [Paludibacter sp.]